MSYCGISAFGSVNPHNEPQIQLSWNKTLIWGALYPYYPDKMPEKWSICNETFPFLVPVWFAKEPT